MEIGDMSLIDQIQQTIINIDVEKIKFWILTTNN